MMIYNNNNFNNTFSNNSNKDINILISRKRLEWIAHNVRVSDHAEFRMVQRDTQTQRNLCQSILNSPLAWFSSSGALIVAFNLYEYVVISVEQEIPTVITFANMTDKGGTVIEKMIVDYKKKLNERRY